MTQTELLADLLNRNLDMLKMTLADFSDADMLVRPTPGANHAAWQVGHLVMAEGHLVNAAKAGTVPPPPPGYAEKFNKKTASVDDPAAFPKKAELLEQLGKARTATIEWVRSLKPADLDAPIPEPMNRFAPTVGHLAAALPSHVTMHVGQFQVIRRKLGKPVLF